MTNAPMGVVAFVGTSPAAAFVRAQLAAFASSDCPCLLIGDSGSGKELAARILHEASARRAKPFVAIDCGAIAQSLLESELFGHVRGAFTSASGDRRGLFEEAHGGTLFLDEISSATPAFQACVLRALETRLIRPVGGNGVRAVDVRVIAASNRDLRADAAAGRFRADLLWRLDVLRIHLPSLAHRREDVPAIAEHLLRVIDERIGASHELSPETKSVLAARSWPGNARELRNALEYSVAMAGGEPVIAPHHLPTHEASDVVYTVPPTWARFRAREERAFLLEVLVAHKWNRTRAARTLGMSRQALHERIRKLGLRPVLVPPVDAVHEAGVGELAPVAVSSVGRPAGSA